MLAGDSREDQPEDQPAEGNQQLQELRNSAWNQHLLSCCVCLLPFLLMLNRINGSNLPVELNFNDLLPDSQLVSSPEDMTVLGREGAATVAVATKTLSCHLFISPLTFPRPSAPTSRVTQGDPTHHHHTSSVVLDLPSPR